MTIPSPDVVSEADVQQLIDDQVLETDVLDFKGGLYRSSDPGWKEGQEYAKDVAALANHRGGRIVIGVKDKDGVAEARKPIAGTTAEVERRRMGQWLAKYLAPMLPVEIEEIADSGGGFYLVVNVPASNNQPHAVLSDNNRRPLVYPVRDGQDTRFLNEHEVARRYAERSTTRAEWQESFDALISDAHNSLGNAPAAWLWLAIRPYDPVDRRLDTELSNAIAKWFRETLVLEGPLGSDLYAESGLVGPGFVEFTAYRYRDTDDEADPRATYVQLHADGSAFCAVDLDFRTSEDNEEGHVGYFTIVDSMIPMVDAAARWAVEATGGLGSTGLAVGIVNSNPGDPSVLLVDEEFGGGLKRMRQTRPLKGERATFRTNTTADLGGLSEVRSRLALTHTCLSYVLQKFGRPEPAQITADGAIVPTSWKRTQQVENWVSWHDLATAERTGRALQV